MKFTFCTNDSIYKMPDFSDVSNIVDRSDFRPDSEQVRALKFNPAGSAVTSVPQYDYPDGRVPANDTVTDTLIALRSGKLDKADIQALSDAISKDAKSADDKKHTDALLKAIDKSLGVESSSDSKA